MTPKERNLLCAIAQYIAWPAQERSAQAEERRELIRDLLEDVRDEDGTGIAPKPRLSKGQEHAKVFALGNTIGYGRVMQLCEEIWREKSREQNIPGSEHSVGPCVAFLVPCEHQGSERGAVGCDWCCGSGRVTKRVLQAMQEVAKT